MELEKSISGIKWYWVVGSIERGFRIVNKLPKSKNVREPHSSLESAKRWISLEYLLNA